MSDTTVLTDVEFASRALKKAGVPSGITDFTGDETAETAAAIYWTHTASLLTLTVWRFNSITLQLSRMSTPPPSRWAYRFSLPADRLGDPLSFSPDGDMTAGSQQFEIFEDELWCDDDIAFIVYQRRPSSPGKWGPVFMDFALTSLAAELALTINEDRKRYETFKIQAYGSLDEARMGGKLALALAREVSSVPPVQINPSGGPLLGARLGGY